MLNLQNHDIALPTSPDEISYGAMQAWLKADQIAFVRAITGKEMDAEFCAAYCQLCRQLMNEVASMSGASKQSVTHGGKTYTVPAVLEMPTEMFVAATKMPTDIERLAVYCPVTSDLPYHVVKPLLAFFLNSWLASKRLLLHGLRVNQHLHRQQQAMSEYRIYSDGIRLSVKRRPTILSLN